MPRLTLLWIPLPAAVKGFEGFNTRPNGKDTAAAKDWLRHREEATRAGKKPAQLVGCFANRRA